MHVDLEDDRFWVKTWLAGRLDYDHCDRLIAECLDNDIVGYIILIRMDPAMSHQFLVRLTPRMEKSKYSRGRPSTAERVVENAF